MKENIPFSIFSNRFYLECYISYGNIWDLHHRVVGWLAHCEYVHGICIHCCLTFIEKNSGSRSVQQLNNGAKAFLKLNCRIFKVTRTWIWMAKRPGVTSDTFQACQEFFRSQNKKKFWNHVSPFWDNPIFPLLSI